MTLKAAYMFIKKTFVRISKHTHTHASAHSNPVSRKTGQIPPAAVGGFDTREEKENDSRSGLCPLVQWDWFFYTVFFRRRRRRRRTYT